MQIFSHLLQREYFQIGGLMDENGGRRNVRFRTKNWPYFGNGER